MFDALITICRVRLSSSFVEQAHDVPLEHDIAPFVECGGGFCDFGGIKILVLIGRDRSVEVGHK